jgi:predicted RNase H-like HicB family nuclease
VRYLAKIYRFGNGYSAMIPDLPGCVAAADTLARTRKMIAKAAALHLDMMRDNGERVPSPKQRAVFAADSEDAEEYCTWIKVEDRELASVA